MHDSLTIVLDVFRKDHQNSTRIRIPWIPCSERYLRILTSTAEVSERLEYVKSLA